MARNQSALVQWSQYLPLRAFASVVDCLPMSINMHAGKCVGDILYMLDHRHRERAMNNIRRSFPEYSEEQVKKLTKQSMEYMFQLFTAEAVKMPSLVKPTTIDKYITFTGLEHVTERLVNKQPTIFITGHCGNWELLGYALSVLGYPIAALARPLDNSLINDYVLNIRQRYGLKIVTKWGGVPILQELISKNVNVGFIADQNAGHRGMFVPFFGRLASTYKSIGLLAMRYNIPIAAVHARRIGKQFKYEVTLTDFITPEEWQQHDDPLFYITARYNHAIETMIRNAPEQYLWLHRRWKSRPSYEEKGKPMPKKVISQLESLPWLSDDDLARLIEC